jgi:Leucine-rich repeat (LRR) protein
MVLSLLHHPVLLPTTTTTATATRYIDNNEIDALAPDIFAHNLELKALSLQHNYITVLPPQIFANNKHLMFVTLNYNRIWSYPFNFLQNVTGLIEGEINIVHNGPDDEDDGFTCLTRPKLGDDGALHLECSCPDTWNQKTEGPQTCCIAPTGPNRPCISGGSDVQGSSSGGGLLGMIVGGTVAVCVTVALIGVAVCRRRKLPSVYAGLPSNDDDDEMIEMMADVKY